MTSAQDFVFRWATSADEPEMRALVGSVPMPGAVSVRFAREPDYFLGTTIMGDPCDVLTARHAPDGELAGIACRTLKRAFLNGQESPLGYVGQIRVLPQFQGRWLVQRGAEVFREGSPDGIVYMGVIASDNPRALRLLVGERLPGGLQARRMGGITTLGIFLRRRRGSSAIETRPAVQDELHEIVAFLRGEGARRQFFPAYTVNNFVDGSRLRGMRVQDVFVARRGGAIVGVMAAWDQSLYKQNVVAAYGPRLRRVRPLFDMLAPLMGAKRLTPPGQAIPLVFAACVCVQNDDAAVMGSLLQACARSGHERGKAFLMIGLPDGDPLLAAARKFMHVTYHSELVAVSWSAEALRRLDSRTPYVEIATL
jgi:hypothetical protein